MDPYASRPQNRSHIIRHLNICLITFSTLFLIGRLYSRHVYTKSAGLDDAIAIFAWAVICSESGMELVAATRGTGQHIWNIPPAKLASFFSLVPTMELLYIVGTGSVRLSMVAFLPRLNGTGSIRFRRIILSLATAIIVVTVVFFVYYITSCRPVKDLWHQTSASTCLTHPEQNIFFGVHAAFGVVFDLCLLSVPIWLVYTHMTFNWRTVKVMLVFSVGVFVFAVGLVRFVVNLRIDETIDTTWYFLYISLWSLLEVHIGFWVACFPAFVPFLRLAFHRVVPAPRDYNAFPDFENPGAKALNHIHSVKIIGSGTASEDNMGKEGANLQLANIETWDSSKGK